MAERQRQLLPSVLVPSLYDLHLVPDLEAFTFTGDVSIVVEVKEETSLVTFHTLDLDILSVSFLASKEDSEKVKPNKTTYCKESQQTTLHFETPLLPGSGTLSIQYTGTLNDKMVGFYRSKYVVAETGEEKWMATTQFESTDARRAFPCWDEPAIKATFKVSLTIPNHLSALSNMPITGQEPADKNCTRFSFDESPIMSTYLLAFIVGEFDYVEDTTKEGVIVRVYTPLGKSKQGKFALSVGTRTLSFFTEYFGIAYPLPKADMIAIADFSSGAMENWGLITYRETALLIDESSSIINKQRAAYVVAHELAHQWFGNLVTMEWWKELWLNEGFATWVGNLAVAEFYPEWDIWTSFGSNYFSRAQSLDSMLTTHPVEVEVYNSDEIDEIFDLISYSKGASIIRMVATYLGEEAFKAGLNIYLNRHQYANATTDDLWKALGESSGKDVKTFMDNWTKRPGLPVLRVEQNPERPNELTFTQERFLSSGASPTEEQNSIWNCSVGFLTAKSESPLFLEFNQKVQTLTLPPALIDDHTSWIKINAEQSGFFFVHYTSSMIQNLVVAVQEGKLSSVDRIGLLSDAYSLTKSGRMKTSDLLKLTQGYAANETEKTVYSEISSILGSVKYIWENEACVDVLKTFCCSFFSPVVQRLGWDVKESDSDLDKLLRGLAIRCACSFGDQSAIDEGLRRFEEGNIDSDLRGLVYKIAVKYGDEKNFDKMLSIYRTAPMHAEKLQALVALGGSQDDEKKRWVLNFSLGEEVRTQDLMYGLLSTSGTLKGTELTWEFLTSHWAEYLAKLDGNNHSLGNCIKYSASGFISDEKAAEIESFFKENPAPQVERAIQQTLEATRAKAAWFARDKEDVLQFFSSHA